MKTGILKHTLAKLSLVFWASVLVGACAISQLNPAHIIVPATAPVTMDYVVENSLTKKVTIELENPKNYAYLSLYANEALLIDNLNVPKSGDQVLNALVRFEFLGDVQLRLKSTGADITVKRLKFEDLIDLQIPAYQDISSAVGIHKTSSLKYGGPTVADLDNDGDYDFILNNHNQADTKLYWNNGDATITPHSKNLSRWFMHDLHGTAAGDYDNDGDLDLVVTQGGGNGTNPSKANFYNNNEGRLVLMTGDVGIDKGGRGRGAKWSDMDLDGDLDLFLFNEQSLDHQKPQHLFYENMGNGTFNHKSVEGIQDVEPSRVLVTDLNGDHVDDLILFAPLSVWQGNGDFTFTDVTTQFPEDISQLGSIMAIADLDIDNDGDLDLYLARGKALERVYDETPSMDFDPTIQELSLKPRGLNGVDEIEFTAPGSIEFHDYFYSAQGHFRGKDYPVYLGESKVRTDLAIGQDMIIEPEQAAGWPDDVSENGMYFGYLGDGRWKAVLVRNGDLFWSFKFSLSGVTSVSPKFIPQNRNEADILLRNDVGVFTDVSAAWNLQPGGNALGVTVGDFNNDSHHDVFVYRWGMIGARISDWMLLNTGEGRFETVTMHGANDFGGPGNGDMGQAFDFDQDGDLDLLNGSEGGEWYLYENAQPGSGNYALVRVGHAPVSNVDAISAEVTVKTAGAVYRKRVGSAGAVFSQSLLNIVHFGLGDEEKIESISVRWRNGEKVQFTEKPANRLFDTNNLDPDVLILQPASVAIRKGTSYRLEAIITPDSADTSLLWQSSNDSVAKVDDTGSVEAVGDIGESATITAKSVANGRSTSSAVTIAEWTPVPVQAVSLVPDQADMFIGDTMALNAALQPAHADNAELLWTSSDEAIASVDSSGTVTAIGAGSATIMATSADNSEISSTVQINVEPHVEGFIRIIDEDKYRTGDFVTGESITLNVEYHAGSGNHVIMSDEGGIRFWLRHFQSEWIPAKDMVFVDDSVLKTTSGSSSMTIPLDGLTPTVELPEGHFYYLRASFAASDGNTYNAGIYPVSIVKAQTN